MPRILVCDDESHIRRAIEMKLSRAGLDVVTATDGRDGFEKARELLPDLILSDLQMPHASGLDLCRALRDDPATSGIPFLLLTAKGFELDESKLREDYGVAKLFMKPFSPRELLATVLDVLDSTETRSSEPAPTESTPSTR